MLFEYNGSKIYYKFYKAKFVIWKGLIKGIKDGKRKFFAIIR